MHKHKIRYEVANGYRPKEDWRHWEINVHATRKELRTLGETGYLVRENILSAEHLEQLRTALDRLEKKESANRGKETANDRSWGYFPRHLVDKDPVFLDLMTYAPLFSIARAMLGPLVRLRVSFARICYPEKIYPHQTAWHQHMTVISHPLPPWFSRPHCVDCLIYLDDLDSDTGPLVVVPGSHEWLDREPPLNSSAHVEGEIEIRVKAGTAVLMHGNLWHRAMPTLRRKRRVIIISYTPTWLRKSPHGGPQPENGLTQSHLENASFEEKMLLGIGGYS